MTHTVVLETGIVDAEGILPEIPGTIEIVATMYMEERKYSMGGPGTCIEEYPVIEEITFEASIGVGSPEASAALAKYLEVLYETDKEFQARVAALVMEDLEERWSERDFADVED